MRRPGPAGKTLAPRLISGRCAVETLRVFLVASVTLFLVATSCGGDGREEVLVFAAASLTDALQEIGSQFAEREGVKVSFNFGGSTSMAQQIIRGAPADAFVSAGAQPLEMLEDRGLLMQDTRVDLLTNELVLVASPGVARDSGIRSLEDLAGSDARLAVADPDLAPAGRYTRDALQNMGLWQDLKSRMVFGSDVRATLGYVDTGNVDAGIVYVTDAGMIEGLEVISLVPKDNYTPIVYPAGVLERSGHAEAALKFLEYLQGDEARRTFLDHGFSPLE